ELAMFFSIGIAAFSVPMGLLVKKLSPRTMLSVALLGYAGATAIFPFLLTFGGLASARGLDGAFSVGVWVSLETILLMRTSSAHRGLITSLYTISMAVGYGVGAVFGWIIMLTYPMPMVFVSAGLFASLAALVAYVFLDRDIRPIAGSDHAVEEALKQAPRPETPIVVAAERPSILQLYWKIKT